MSPSHTVGSERRGKRDKNRKRFKVSIPHGGLGTKMAKVVMPLLSGEVRSPSHAVDSEQKSYTLS